MMIVRFAIVLLSTFAQHAALAGSTSTRIVRTAQDIKAGGDKEKRTNRLRQAKKVEPVETSALRDGDMINEGGESPNSLGLRALIGENDSRNWNHGTYKNPANRRDRMEICAPSATRDGDTLFAFLSSSGGHLPLHLDQWTRGAECFKSSNSQKECFRASHCVQEDGPFCAKFRYGKMTGEGNDLGTVMFYHKVTKDDSGCWDVDLKGGNTWAFVTAITNVNERDPIQDISGTSCDKSTNSVFSSVLGRENDVLLLSQSFDDPASMNDFSPPSGTSILGYLKVNDDAGYLFGEELDRSGETGSLRTGGRGGHLCKDALLSVVVNRANNA